VLSSTAAVAGAAQEDAVSERIDTNQETVPPGLCTDAIPVTITF